jgi:putative Mg2+ transporter-C (MgtC) family protein
MWDSIDLDTNLWESLIRLLIAALCGAGIGWDREALGHDAGLRTHIMVALGAAGFTLVAIELHEALGAVDGQPSGDVVRILAAIVGGVGFLGAGAIIQSNREVRGLTTAAGLWVTAAVGISAGTGFYANAVLITLMAVVTLSTMRHIEHRIRRRDS